MAQIRQSKLKNAMKKSEHVLLCTYLCVSYADASIDIGSVWLNLLQPTNS